MEGLPAKFLEYREIVLDSLTVAISRTWGFFPYLRYEDVQEGEKPGLQYLLLNPKALLESLMELGDPLSDELGATPEAFYSHSGSNPKGAWEVARSYLWDGGKTLDFQLQRLNLPILELRSREAPESVLVKFSLIMTRNWNICYYSFFSYPNGIDPGDLFQMDGKVLDERGLDELSRSVDSRLSHLVRLLFQDLDNRIYYKPPASSRSGSGPIFLLLDLEASVPDYYGIRPSRLGLLTKLVVT